MPRDLLDLFLSLVGACLAYPPRRSHGRPIGPHRRIATVGSARVAGSAAHGRGGSTRTLAPPDSTSRASIPDRQTARDALLCTSGCKITAGTRRVASRACLLRPAEHGAHAPETIGAGWLAVTRRPGESCRPFRRAYHLAHNFPRGMGWNGWSDARRGWGDGRRLPAQASGAGISLLEGTEITRGPRIGGWDGRANAKRHP